MESLYSFRLSGFHQIYVSDKSPAVFPSAKPRDRAWQPLPGVGARGTTGAHLDHVLLDAEWVAVPQDAEQLIIGNEEEPRESVSLGV